jgi:recombination protein RecA
VKVKIVKNKVAPPFKNTEFDIMYGEGISKVGEILDLGVEFDIVKKSGSWFSYGDTKLGQGRDAVKELLKDNPELLEELAEKIKVAIKEKK